MAISFDGRLPVSSLYSSTQDIDDTIFSIEVVVRLLLLLSSSAAAPIVLLDVPVPVPVSPRQHMYRYSSRKVREVPPINRKCPIPRNMKDSTSTSDGRS